MNGLLESVTLRGVAIGSFVSRQDAWPRAIEQTFVALADRYRNQDYFVPTVGLWRTEASQASLPQAAKLDHAFTESTSTSVRCAAARRSIGLMDAGCA
jgi:hypothetical protein